MLIANLNHDSSQYIYIAKVNSIDPTEILITSQSYTITLYYKRETTSHSKYDICNVPYRVYLCWPSSNQI